MTDVKKKTDDEIADMEYGDDDCARPFYADDGYEKLPAPSEEKSEKKSGKKDKGSDRPWHTYTDARLLPDAVRERIKDWYIDRVSITRMQKVLKREGYDLSYTTLRSYCNEQYKDSIFVEPPESNIDILEFGHRAIFSTLNAIVQQIRGFKRLDIGELSLVATTIHKCLSAEVMLRKTEIEEKISVEKAIRRLKLDLQEHLATKPELLESLLKEIDNIHRVQIEAQRKQLVQ
jgi:hypothetical protein